MRTVAMIVFPIFCLWLLLFLALAADHEEQPALAALVCTAFLLGMAVLLGGLIGLGVLIYG